jgi:hypothetical protein
MIRQAWWSAGVKADMRCCGLRDAWILSSREFSVGHEISCGPYPSPPKEFTRGRVPIDVARGVFGVAIMVGAVLILPILLNRL